MFDVRPIDVADDLALGKEVNLPKIIKLLKEKKHQDEIALRKKIFKQKRITRGLPIKRTKLLLRKSEFSKIGVIQMNKFYHRGSTFPVYIEIKKKKPKSKGTIKNFCFEKKEKPAENKKENYFQRETVKEKEEETKVKISYEFGTKNNFLTKNKDEKYARFFGQIPEEKHEDLQKKAHSENKNIEKTFPENRKGISLATDFFKKISFRPAISFAGLSVIVFLVVISIKFISYSLQKKDDIMGKGMTAIAQLAEAKNEIVSQDFQGAGQDIENAKASFKDAREELDQIGGNLSNIFSGLPFLSKISSGKNLLSAGEEISEAARRINQTVAILNQLENPLDENSQKNIGNILLDAGEQILQSKEHLEKSSEYLNKVKVSDLPDEFQADFSLGKETLPRIIKLVENLEENYQVLYEILGYNGPRKYLFLFQNNQEMRATGGFIGSYGVLNIDRGKVESLLIDGIFNPDGQLYEKVVPPEPIQKISATWSTHDANWFPNFPTSAEKIAWFYEKTGGPTVDGVITVTPTILQKMLEITGPIEMPEYETTVDKDNFIENTQREVEIDYDKDINQPKKFIADLTPKIFEKVFASHDPQNISKTIKVMSKAMREKHILIYSFNYNIQKLISQQNWSGEILQTNKDYLMVANSNINGYKTDGVIDESITHNAEIQGDGSTIDTVKIKRVHNGGNTEFDWWNKVNSDYMRVYVPEGSQLLEARGQTREFNQPPLDYDALNFRRDPQVQQEEDGIKIDEKTGTRVYDEEGKTVFANWVYVSPQETVEVEYKYLLPFKVDFNKNKDRVDSYSILFQKQSGSVGSELNFRLDYPDQAGIIWSFPQQKKENNTDFDLKGKLSTDEFFGAVLQKR